MSSTDPAADSSIERVVYEENPTCSRPPAEQCHDTAAEEHADEGVRHLPVGCGNHLLVEEELVREKLPSDMRLAHAIFSVRSKRTHFDETGVDQDSGAEGVQDAADDAGGRAVRVVRRADAEADRDACAEHK